MSEQGQNNDLELLTFRVADQEYSLDIMSVREIRGWTRTTPMPHAPDYMRGVINLRGTVLPVMDLARRLHLPSQETNDRNVIIVVNLNGTLTGLLVDAVSDIVAITEDDLQPPPRHVDRSTNVGGPFADRDRRSHDPGSRPPGRRARRK